MTTSTIGVAKIGDERRRQIEAEGYTPEHDAEHNDASLTVAAMCYANAALAGPAARASEFTPPEEWPWEAGAWKPSDDPIRNLEKAGALIAAEIDRLSRYNGQTNALER